VLVDLFRAAYYTIPMNQQRIQELKEEIADLKKRLPAHSIPPAMLIELEELEDELAELIKKEHQEQNDA
jgi:hypothetical protein